jgi:hypothetical protein
VADHNTKMRMYEENRKSLNAFVGCEHGCVYCLPSFQRQAKRQKNRCLDCYNYEPHFHAERLLKAPPKTVGNQFVFFPSSGDLAFADARVIQLHIEYAEKYRDITFLIQSKAPAFFGNFNFPDNVILGTTIETDRVEFWSNPSKYKTYWEISKARPPKERAFIMMKLAHKRKAVTVEPILSFHLHNMLSLIENIEPEFVYVGYDNHNCKLPEPSLEKTRRLIADLELITEVRVKTLRKAWWEKFGAVDGEETP